MKLSLQILFIIIGHICTSQTISEEVLWIGETNFEYKFEDDFISIVDHKTISPNGFPIKSETILLKMNILEEEHKLPNFQFEKWLTLLMKSEQTDIIRLADDKKMEIDEIYFIMSEQEQNNDSTCLVVDGNNKEIISYKIKQIWYYGVNSNKLYSYPIEIIPIFYGVDLLKEEFFKIILNNELSNNQDTDLLNPEINWVVANTLTVPFDKSFKTTKGNYHKFFQFYLMESEYECEDFFSQSNSRCNKLDEILNAPYVWDSIAWKNEVKIESEMSKRDILFDDIKALKIEQYFYLNSKTNSLGSRVKTVSPLIKKKLNKHGNIGYIPVWRIKNEK